MLTEEGKTYAAVGSPEFQLFSAVPSEGIAREDLLVALYLILCFFFLTFSCAILDCFYIKQYKIRDL